MNVFQKLRAQLQLREAIKMANRAHAESGARYYVIPGAMDKRKLLVIDRANFRKMKQKGYITEKAYVRDLELECFYFTPYRNGSCAITRDIFKIKTEQYKKWCESVSRKRNGKQKSAKAKS